MTYLLYYNFNDLWVCKESRKYKIDLLLHQWNMSCMTFLEGIGYFHHALLYCLLVNKTFTVEQLVNYKALKK